MTRLDWAVIAAYFEDLCRAAAADPYHLDTEETDQP